MHRHEYEFWLRKYDLDGFSAGAWEIKKGAASTEPHCQARGVQARTRAVGPVRATHAVGPLVFTSDSQGESRNHPRLHDLLRRMNLEL